MPLTIVRVAGIHLNATLFQSRLAGYIHRQNAPALLVTASHPELYASIRIALETVFTGGADYSHLENRFLALWTNIAGGEPTPEFLSDLDRLTSLLKGIYFTGDYSPALRDAVMSQSEVLTARLLVGQLVSIGTDARVILPSEIGLEATPDFGNATFSKLDVELLKSKLGKSVLVVPGSFGITGNGKIARAGISAADYTAAFIAAETGAEKLILWGSTGAFYAADRRIVPHAGVIEQLTYSEASELAYFDHFSLHPRAVEPLIANDIPIHLLSPETENDLPETIINSDNAVAASVVKSVACTNDISVLRLNGPGVGLKPGILARITGKLAEESVNIKSVITSQVSINILVDSQSGAKAREVAHTIGFTAVNEIELVENVSLVAIVGHGMQTSYGISARLFAAVAGNRINVILSGSGASDLVSYLVVGDSDRERSVHAIYDAFFTV